MKVFASLVLVAGLLLSSRAVAQTGPSPVSITAADIGRTVEKLGADDLVIVAEAEAELIAAGPIALSPLAGALSSTKPPMRRRAADVLGRLGDARAVPALTHALHTSGRDEVLDVEVSRALLSLGSKIGIPPLLDHLESADLRVRFRAWIALRRFTHRDFDFRPDDAQAKRAAAVQRWRDWWGAAEGGFAPIRPEAR